MAPRIRESDPTRRVDRPDLTHPRVTSRPVRTEAPRDVEGPATVERPRWERSEAYAERAPRVGDGDRAETDDPRGPEFRSIGASGSTARPSGAHAAPGASSVRASRRTGIGAGGGSARPSDSPADAPGGMDRAAARAIIDEAMSKAVTDLDSDDYVRNNVTAEVLAHATVEEKAHMLRSLMDGWTGEEDQAAMARILESVGSPAEMETLLRRAGGAEAVLSELGETQLDAVANHFRGQGANGARMLITISNELDTSSSWSDDFVRNHIDASVLQHATNEEKGRMLRHLMEGITVAEDEAAMARVLSSVTSPDDMMEVIAAAGGSEAVMDELEGATSTFMQHLDSLGADGDQIIARMAADYAVGSWESDDFVRNYVDADVLQHATQDQKAHMLRSLMDGWTGEGDEQAMVRVLNSATDRADLEALMTAAGGADTIWNELEGQQSAFIAELRGRGATGEEMILGLALAHSDDSTGAQLIRDHVDARVLAHATVAEKGALVAALRAAGTSSENQAAIREILRSAANPVELMDIAQAAGGVQQVLGLTPAQRQLVTDAYNANSGDATFTQNLENLITDPNFTRLSSDQRTAVLSQAKNYPDARSVANLTRLMSKDWFRSMSLADTQRSAAMIAYVSQHAGDRTIIDNTLDRFLADDAPYTFDWGETGTPYGSAGSDTFHFNRAYLPAGNGPVDTTNANTLHMVTHTVAHEVNHLVNNDRVRESFDYFMEEYRAFYVGFRAQHGRDPTRAEVLNRVRGLLTANSGAYNSIRLALADATEGPRFLPFLQQVLGRNDVTQANAGTLPVVNGGAPAPAPTDGGDMDN